MTTAAATAPNPPQIEGSNFLNLMIVDDERAIREACREIAQSLGFNTCVADSAEHAYRLLDAQGVDVVLLDLKLPGAGEALPDHRQGGAQRAPGPDPGRKRHRQRNGGAIHSLLWAIP